jgi:hypothetical protein
MYAGAQHFVYYRVRREHRGQAEAAVRALHAQLQSRWPGLRCRLYRRAQPATVDEDTTLMEVYDGVPSPDAAAEVEALACSWLALWMIGERHVEVFEPCA